MGVSRSQAKPAVFELAPITNVWECDTQSARSTLQTLVERGLVESIERGKFQIHQVLVKHAKLTMESGEFDE